MNKEMETKESIIKNANEKMNEFINKMKKEYDFEDYRYCDATSIEFDGTKTITVKWWGGCSESTFRHNDDNFSTGNYCETNIDDLNVITDFYNEYYDEIMHMLNWYAAEMARAESTGEVDAAGGFYLKD